MVGAIRILLSHLFNVESFSVYTLNYETLYFSFDLPIILSGALIFYFCCYFVLLWRYIVRIFLNDF